MRPGRVQGLGERQRWRKWIIGRGGRGGSGGGGSGQEEEQDRA